MSDMRLGAAAGLIAIAAIVGIPLLAFLAGIAIGAWLW